MRRRARLLSKRKPIQRSTVITLPMPDGSKRKIDPNRKNSVNSIIKTWERSGKPLPQSVQLLVKVRKTQEYKIN